jgi:hypothetical protein
MKNCLTDEEMSAFVDGALAAEERARVEKHLAACDRCLRAVAELARLAGDPAAYEEPSPEALAAARKVIDRLAPAGETFDIVAVLKEGVCRILQTTGNLLPPADIAPAPARAPRPSETGRLAPRVSRALAGHLVTVELEASGDEIRPRISVTEESTGEGAEGLKIRLHSEDSTETGYTESGEVAFPARARGSFTIEMEDVGSITVEVT